MFFYVRCYLLVTVEAQMLLRGFFERFVALLALGFIFGMTTYHLARHDQRFQAGCGGC